MPSAAKPEVQQHIIESTLAGSVACQIGQINQSTARALDKLVAKGKLAKWRGHWYPTAGAPWGIGPLKSCWGTVETRDYFASFRIARTPAERAVA